MKSLALICLLAIKKSYPKGLLLFAWSSTITQGLLHVDWLVGQDTGVKVKPINRQKRSH